MYLDVNNLYGWILLERPSTDVFKWRNDEFDFNEKLITKLSEDSDKGDIHDFNISILSIYTSEIFIYHHYQNEQKLESAIIVFVTCTSRKEYWTYKSS